MTRDGREDEWEDLVRRLEAADSSRVDDPSAPGWHDGAPGPGGPAGSEGPTGPEATDRPGHPAARRSGDPDAPSGPAGTGHPAPHRPGDPDAPRRPGAVADPASSGTGGTLPDPDRFRDPGIFAPVHGAGPAGPRDWEAAEDDSDFEPPDPGPVLTGNPTMVLAWIAATVFPAVLVVLVVVARTRVPALAWWVLVLATLGSWLFLAWRLPREHRDDGDDGARV